MACETSHFVVLHVSSPSVMEVTYYTPSNYNLSPQTFSLLSPITCSIEGHWAWYHTRVKPLESFDAVESLSWLNSGFCMRHDLSSSKSRRNLLNVPTHRYMYAGSSHEQTWSGGAGRRATEGLCGLQDVPETGPPLC